MRQKQKENHEKSLFGGASPKRERTNIGGESSKGERTPVPFLSRGARRFIKTKSRGLETQTTRRKGKWKENAYVDEKPESENRENGGSPS